MIGSNLFLVPPSRFTSLEPELDVFATEFDEHSVERLDFGYWELFAHQLANTSVVGDVLFTGEAEGWFIFEWSPAFVSAFIDARPDAISHSVKSLLSDSSSAGMSEHDIVHECNRLRELFARARAGRLSIVEVSPA